MRERIPANLKLLGGGTASPSQRSMLESCKTIRWEEGKVVLIDQTLLPLEYREVSYTDYKDLSGAISTLKVRGAPALGIAGALGMVLAAWQSKASSYAQLETDLDNCRDFLKNTRPTAVNLSWGIERIHSVALTNKDKPIDSIKSLLLQEANRIIEEDHNHSLSIGEWGAQLIRQGDTILTHCNTGGLATGGYGTALAIIFTAAKKGKHIKVFADETRPLLQGARLTTWELNRANIDVTLICDSVASHVMSRGWINNVIVGADRIAANGDTANKIGTYNLAIAAREHTIPFYVAAPSSTFDLSLKSGKEIPIEERDPSEVTSYGGKQTAPQGIKVYNPAFDITPANYISAIICERGIARPPYKKSLKKLTTPFHSVMLKI